ncbi:hypothetical protein NIES4072_40280 [Nostoc commune NIES-4072]|uniref:Uncharacterized protein n=1 Tax=Nostoc commune NIES-4072 TaxID=2005467 RepID=A0A2R5FWX9_NOSCO|nr:hypothetical protein [Nostoc commune]BBD68650.1 hypothetical protein NIES4070_50500 [Nostoc commune HK-02]GBG20351.1 hypothetical protein NIES4072_40280 [Nostoc commune NIES-4072]
MAEPTLADIFGSNATQTATTITIAKADLPRLTANANNTAESLLTGILLKAQTSLTQTNFDSNINQSIYVNSGFSSFTTRGTNNDAYRVDQLIINFAKLDISSTIDPDDY